MIFSNLNREKKKSLLPKISCKVTQIYYMLYYRGKKIIYKILKIIEKYIVHIITYTVLPKRTFEKIFRSFSSYFANYVFLQPMTTFLIVHRFSLSKPGGRVFLIHPHLILRLSPPPSSPHRSHLEPHQISPPNSFECRPLEASNLPCKTNDLI